mmetsp:Transcript_20038/g.46657  ORF Transcript_20038/g.46657 Transcript_20038/m.46657 type:complete len:470 (+) Transcript_20038:128-1537(+)
MGEEPHSPTRIGTKSDTAPTSPQLGPNSQPAPHVQRDLEPFFIGIAGGSASGKTTVCDEIVKSLAPQRVVVLNLDDFYRDLTREEMEHVDEFNFDVPDAFDIPCMVQCITTLRNRIPIEVPIYDFVHNKRSGQTRSVAPAEVVIVEGILVLHMRSLRELFNMKIFVDTDDDVRLARRIRRDTCERGRSLEMVLAAYDRFVKPAFDQFVRPSRIFADVIVPFRNANPVAVDLITRHIQMKLGETALCRKYSNLTIMPGTMQTRYMHTIIRSSESGHQDFVFYADRLIRLLVEYALGLIPLETKFITTPMGQRYEGLQVVHKIAGVSIIRSGEAMESALKACCQGVKMGKILIHKPSSAGKMDNDVPTRFASLPSDVKERQILLMDPILATGRTITSAVEVLKDHGVDEANILLLTLIAAPQGVQQVCEAFPALRVVTTELDSGVNEEGHLLPGAGDFGDRYFGTSNLQRC